MWVHASSNHNQVSRRVTIKWARKESMGLFVADTCRMWSYDIMGLGVERWPNGRGAFDVWSLVYGTGADRRVPPWLCYPRRGRRRFWLRLESGRPKLDGDTREVVFSHSQSPPRAPNRWEVWEVRVVVRVSGADDGLPEAPGSTPALHRRSDNPQHDRFALVRPLYFAFLLWNRPLIYASFVWWASFIWSELGFDMVAAVMLISFYGV